MTDRERERYEKEIKGLKARLNWDHISAGQREAYQERIAYIETLLRPSE